MIDQLGPRAFGQGAAISPQKDARHTRWPRCLPRPWNPQRPLNRHSAFDKQSMTILRQINLPPNDTFASSLLVVCLPPPWVSNRTDKTTRPREEIVALLIVCNLGKHGNVAFLRTVRITLTFFSPDRLRSAWDSHAPFHAQPRSYILKAVFYVSLSCVPLEDVCSTLLLGYLASEATRSLFGFLKYNGPRRLRSCRKILIDESGYLVTHIGQGAFADISRVLYRPTGDVRVMKRITFDDSGLAKYLAKNEVDGLKAVAGNIWFPRLINEFAEGNQFVVTMVRYTEVCYLSSYLLRPLVSLSIDGAIWPVTCNTRGILDTKSLNFTLRS